jgi:Mor family transcriptional regulator
MPMKKSAYDGRTIIDDLVDGCADVVDHDTAVKGTRAICRCFGGSLIYIPGNKTTGAVIRELYGVLCEAIGDHDADRMLKKIMALFGGNQVYIPREGWAFREVISYEIYERYGEKKETMRTLCRDYGLSFTAIYRLWKQGRKNKVKELRR